MPKLFLHRHSSPQPQSLFTPPFLPLHTTLRSPASAPHPALLDIQTLTFSCSTRRLDVREDSACEGQAKPHLLRSSTNTETDVLSRSEVK
ncbi:hypothetical protein E2C01_038584 [Portunus trituberculatus]|uniref:Uncharacterized protein n=1 Tax=Portunus trituberculatus TaxID=210409 RepID=A0A5B7FID7_PORTR|nr:hypothetical protein [Portunus trituberculatus]